MYPPQKRAPQEKKSPRPPAPKVTDEKIDEWKAHARRLAKKAASYDLNLTDIEQRIHRVEAQIPDIPPVIRSATECTQIQEALRKVCHLRSQLMHVQNRCIQARAVWGHIIKIVKGYLWVQPEVIALKNDTARHTVVVAVMGKLDWKHTHVTALLEAADRIGWTLKDNQRAILGLVQTTTEERFFYREGMER